MFPKLTNKKIMFALLMLILISAPFANAVVLESGIPNTDLTPGRDIQGITIAQYINYIYLFVLGVVGIAVFASLVFWGVVWISSGIADKRGMALGKIKDAFTGLAIALGAYIILNTINPDLLTLEDLTLTKVATTTKTTLAPGIREVNDLLGPRLLKDEFLYIHISKQCSSLGNGWHDNFYCPKETKASADYTGGLPRCCMKTTKVIQ